MTGTPGPNDSHPGELFAPPAGPPPLPRALHLGTNLARVFAMINLTIGALGVVGGGTLAIDSYIGDRHNEDMARTGIVIGILVFAVSVVIMGIGVLVKHAGVRIRAGAKSARIAAATISLGSCVVPLVWISPTVDSWTQAGNIHTVLVVQSLIALIFTVLLWRPSSNAYFQAVAADPQTEYPPRM